ncbi:DMT family transporter [Melaminivora alkalimesophila]|uniref:DMT family transporter n=1 Tax=Melaminivora alkalimesophila TaxID=1165852 RepID=UPI0006860585|nr:DMT family transporter [Melaminivora alkalimesophila]
MGKPLAVLLAGLAGIAAAIQAAVNATLGTHIRAIPAAFTSFATGTAALLLLTLWAWRGMPLAQISQGYASAPLWSYAGGLLGMVMVIGMTYAVPAVGVSAAISAFVTMQLTGSLVMDTFGLAGRTALPLTWHQVVGVGLILLGARFVLWR